MKEIASQGDVDIKSVIQYIIEGMLYGAQNYNEFRARLRTYERMQERAVTNSKGYQKEKPASKPLRHDARSSRDDPKKTAKMDRCYNCGENGHLSNVLIAQGQTLGYFQTTILVDNYKFPLTFHVVFLVALNFYVPILSIKRRIINRNGVKVNKPSAPIFLSQIREVVEEQVSDWIQKGIVEPYSSEYANPIIIAKNKDFSYCVSTTGN
ncbi:hypothetical protein P5V15_002634 [Pogonomyrmex californicus]